MKHIAWAPENPDLIQVGAVWMEKGMKLDLFQYRGLLGDRVQEIINRSPDPEADLSLLVETMQEQGMLSWSFPGTTPERAGFDLIAENEMFHKTMDFLNLPGPLPKGPVMKHNREAVRVLKGDKAHGLENWMGSLHV